MGFLSRLFSGVEPKPDPLAGVVEDMINMVKAQQEQQNQLLLKFLDVQKDQSATTKKILEMYLAPAGANKTISLNERLFNRENNEATEWDPIVENPFHGIGGEN